MWRGTAQGCFCSHTSSWGISLRSRRAAWREMVIIIYLKSCLQLQPWYFGAQRRTQISLLPLLHNTGHLRYVVWLCLFIRTLGSSKHTGLRTSSLDFCTKSFQQPSLRQQNGGGSTGGTPTSFLGAADKHTVRRGNPSQHKVLTGPEKQKRMR